MMLAPAGEDGVHADILSVLSRVPAQGTPVTRTAPQITIRQQERDRYPKSSRKSDLRTNRRFSGTRHRPARTYLAGSNYLCNQRIGQGTETQAGL